MSDNDVHRNETNKQTDPITIDFATIHSCPLRVFHIPHVILQIRTEAPPEPIDVINVT